MWNLAACSRNIFGDDLNQPLSSLQVDSQNNVFNAAQDNNPTFAGPGVTLIKAMRPWRGC